MTIKSVLTPAEYIGYLKGSIINLLVEADLNCLDRATEMMGELRTLVAETPIRGQSISDESMRAIRDGMIRLGGK